MSTVPVIEVDGHRVDARADRTVAWARRVTRTVEVVGVLALAWMLLPLWGVRLRDDVPITAYGTEFSVMGDYGDRGSSVLRYVDGAQVTFTVPIRNDGRLPTLITKVAVRDDVKPLLHIDGTPGLPRRLGPGEEVQLQVVATLDNCEWYHERELALYDEFEVTTRTLGRTKVESLSLEHDLIVRAPVLANCPGGKLDREFFDRSDVDP